MKKIFSRKYSNELMVGIFFVASIIGLLWLTVSTGKLHVRNEGYNIYVSFQDVSGIQKNSPVMVNGLEVGRVQELKMQEKDDTQNIILKLLINKDTKIGAKPVISIKTLGLMGEKYVHIKSIKSDGLLKPDSFVAGKTPSDMDELFSQVEVISKNINELVISLNQTINENRQALNESMTNISGITDKVNVALEDNQESLNNIIKHLEATSENFEALSADLKSHPWKLLFRSKEKKSKKSKR
jgi:phospholipid/cholesterol/gamma-HCH transport system substrate-binding protein